MAAEPDAEPSRSDVGILFVHGIGTQRKGTQVVPFVKALQRSLLKGEIAVEGEGRFDTDVESVTLTGSEPAHALMAVRRKDSKAQASEWLIAESLWSDSFIPPTVGETLRWLAFTAPLVLTTRAIEGIQRSFRALRSDIFSFWKFAIYLIWVPLALPVGLVAILTIAVLALIRGLIPFAWAKDLIASLELLVTHAIGDSYLYSTDSVNSVAMETAVGRDIDWLRERSAKVVIVAHSQGASVAAAALARRKPVAAFVTLGAGIGQLAWLKRANANNAAGVVALVTWVAALGIAGAAIWAIAVAVGGNLLPIYLIVGFGGLVFVPQLIAGAAVPVLRSTRSELAPVDRLPSPTAPEKWEDLWATSDPVPGGAAAAREYQNVTSIAVWNKGDLLRDHGSYLANGSEVMARIARLALLESREPTRLGAAASLVTTLPLTDGLRHRRGMWIERLRVVLAVGLIAFLVRQWAEVATIGDYWFNRVHSVWADVPVAIPFTTIPTASVLSVVVVTAFFLLVYAVGALIAAAWDASESAGSVRAQLFTPENGFGSRGLFIAFVAYFWLVVALLVLIIPVPVGQFEPAVAIASPVLGALAASVLAQYALTIPFLTWSHDKSKAAWIRDSTAQSRRRAYWRIIPFTTVLFVALLLGSGFVRFDNQVLISVIGFVLIFYVAMALSLRFTRHDYVRPQRERRSFRYFPDGPPATGTPRWVIAVFAELIVIGLQVLAYVLFFTQFSLEAQGYAFLLVVILGFVGTIGFVFWLDDLSGSLDPGSSRWAWLNWALIVISLALSVAFFVRLATFYD